MMMDPQDTPQGTVLAIADGKATVSIETGGCKGCGHGQDCSIGKVGAGRPAARLTLDAPAGLRVGDRIRLSLPASSLPRMALLGYLFPALAMLTGAGIGNASTGSDAATALGALIGLLAALALIRLAVRRLPGLMPTPKIVAVPRFIPIVSSPFTDTEPHHER